MSFSKDRSARDRQKIRVAIVCHIWSHYREAVGRALSNSDEIDYHIFASGESLDGVEHAAVQLWPNFHRSPYRYLGKALWQYDAVRLALSNDFDALILLGDPNFISTWFAAGIARVRGLPCFYWTHGWLRDEHGLRRLVKGVFYKLATGLLLYSERGRDLGIASGYPADRMWVIYNSLDADRSREVVKAIEAGTSSSPKPQSLFEDSSRPILICTGRLTAKVKLDLLFEAAALLQSQRLPLNILLVGDGPERNRLEHKAKELCLNVHFFGPCYDEETVGSLIYHADLTVAPGKLGLTGMHTLMYGTPAITHGDFDNQMPEVEALVEGVTGAFFLRDDAVSLAQVIRNWLETNTDRDKVRRASMEEIDMKWTPEKQARFIEQAILLKHQHSTFKTKQDAA
jgi:glycosyltransferase involved in cell wall biosynthesis